MNTGASLSLRVSVLSVPHGPHLDRGESPHRPMASGRNSRRLLVLVSFFWKVCFKIRAHWQFAVANATPSGTRHITMPQVLTRRPERTYHPSSQARSPAPPNPKPGSGRDSDSSDHPGAFRRCAQRPKPAVSLLDPLPTDIAAGYGPAGRAIPSLCHLALGRARVAYGATQTWRRTLLPTNHD